jgi:hypothetical protein
VNQSSQALRDLGPMATKSTSVFLILKSKVERFLESDAGNPSIQHRNARARPGIRFLTKTTTATQILETTMIKDRFQTSTNRPVNEKIGPVQSVYERVRRRVEGHGRDG